MPTNMTKIPRLPEIMKRAASRPALVEPKTVALPKTALFVDSSVPPVPAVWGAAEGAAEFTGVAAGEVVGVGVGELITIGEPAGVALGVASWANTLPVNTGASTKNSNKRYFITYIQVTLLITLSSSFYLAIRQLTDLKVRSNCIPILLVCPDLIGTKAA